MNSIYRKSRSVLARFVVKLDCQLSVWRHKRIRSTLLIHDNGPGGPLLVVVGDRDDFSRYLIEILRTEGANCFTAIPLSKLNDAVLEAHEVVLLAHLSLSDYQTNLMCEWVQRGGRLLAMRPGPELAPLFGISPIGSSINDGYLKVDVSHSPGMGVTDRVMQFHGQADACHISDASVVAELYFDASSPTSWPAVVTRDLGDGGRVAAFTYDLALSVVQTRQGNPEWVGQNRDGDLLNRSDDLFFGAAFGDPQRDWIDTELLDVPQADEQQRLMMNVLRYLCADRTPLPRFWYLPERHRAAIVMTGDDHALNGTAERFGDYSALDPASSDTGIWTKVRGTSYVYAHSPMTDSEALALEKQGFEISLHLTTKGTEYDLGTLSRAYRRQLKLFRTRYPSVAPPSTHRTHCVVWSDWSTQAEVERANGIRLDTNYYFYPAPWVADRVGLFTGSGMPMRFASLEGEVIDCYQAATQLTDETGQIFPDTIEVALDQALAYTGGVFVLTANMHTDLGASSGSDAIVAEARRRGVPVISARQLLTWLDARSGSSFQAVESVGDILRFTISVASGLNGATACVPLPAGCLGARSVTRNSNAIEFEIAEIWGSSHVVIPATSGNYEISCTREPAMLAVKREVHSAPGIHEVVELSIDEGIHEGTVMSSARGGSIILKPDLVLDLVVDRELEGWESDDKAPAIVDGWVEVADTTLFNTNVLAVGSSFEAEAVFSGVPGESLGLGSNDPGTFVDFFFDDRRQLNARNVVSGHGTITPIEGCWHGLPHRFRIDWDAGLTLFAIDGRTVIEHRVQMRDPLHPTISARSSSTDASGRIKVLWVRTSAFPLLGTFTSKPIDFGSSSTWGHTRLRVPALTMTGAKAAFRAGEAEEPDASWSEWVSPGASGTPLIVQGRYLQYRITLQTASPRWTPEVLGVSIEHLR